MSYYPQFGALLNEYLVKLDRTPAWLARHLGVNDGTVSRWLNNGARPGNPETVVRIADILGISDQRDRLMAAAGYGIYREIHGGNQESEPHPVGTLNSPFSAGDLPTRAVRPQANNLPQPPTPFVGRAVELAQIDQQLHDPACRLLTLVGPGGIGKTRLAIQAGVAQQQFFSDGLHFVNLAPLQTPDLLTATLVETLDLSGSTQTSPEEVLLNYLGSRNMLLILDNFEHLHPGTSLLRKILSRSPDVKLLITSRERLNLQGEWLIPLQGLELPAGLPLVRQAEAARDNGQEGLERYSSVQLFMQCARRVQPDFSLTAENASAVSQLCNLVEGFPLAIELAAAWLRVMPCVSIVTELQAGVDFLSTLLEDVPERHRSMRATLEPSWRLLAPAEQSALCRLSICRGGFTPATAQAVADASRIMLLALVDKSWVNIGAGGRLQMHEFVRQFCEEKITACGLDAEELCRRHALYFASFLHKRENAIHGAGQLAAMRAIVAETDNLRASWQWAVNSVALDVIDLSIESLYWISWVRGWYHETLASFAQAVTRLEEHLEKARQTGVQNFDHPVRYIVARLQSRAASLHERVGTTARGLELCDQSLAQLAMLQEDDHCIRERGYARAIQSHLFFTSGHMMDAIAVSRRAMTDFQRIGGRYGESFAQWVEALAIANHSDHFAAMNLLIQVDRKLEEIGEEYFRAMVLNCLANVSRSVGETARALGAAEQSLHLRRAQDDQRGIAACQAELGFNELRRGDLFAAEPLFLECLHTANRLKDHHLSTVSLQGLGWSACLRGEWEVARQYFEQSLAITQQTGRQMWTAFDHYSLGVVANGQHNLELALYHFSEALNLACKIEDVAAIADALMGMAQLFSHTGKLEQAAQLCAFVVEHPSSLRPVRTEDDLLAQLETNLSSQLYQSAVTAGQAMTAEEAVVLAREHISSA